MHPFLNNAVKAAYAAADIIRKGYSRLDLIKVSSKGPKDFVTNIDKSAERRIIDILRASYPNHYILGEESGSIKAAGKSPYQWIIDPLDGTTNFIHGFPHFSISIALKNNDRIEHGVIYDPIRDDLFTASVGVGTQRNNRRVRVSKNVFLEDCLVATGLPARAMQYYEAHCNTLREFAGTCQSIRRTGSAALDLAYIACGQLDGYWGVALGPWDMAAGILMIKEAGGLVSDCAGKENYFENGTLVAGNAKVLKQLLKPIQKHFKLQS